MIKNSLNPDFAVKLLLEYRFEEQQRLKFSVFDIDSKAEELTDHDFLGGCEATLGEIVSCGRIQKTLLDGPSKTKKNGYIILIAEEVSTCRDEITMSFSGRNLDKKDFFGSSDPFLAFYKVLEDDTRNIVYRSEVIKKNLNPNWKPITLSARLLCNGDYDRTIVIACIDWNRNGKEDLIGEIEITMNQLIEREKCGDLRFPLIHYKKKKKQKGYKNSGYLEINSLVIEKVPTFVEFVQKGTELSCCIAIDFTASNGCPSVPGTLHYCTHQQMSQYAVALQAVGEIISDYDSDNLFPAFGFGASIPPSNVVSHNFPLNGHPENPYCSGIAGVMQAYLHALRTVNLHGPTNFAPIINKVANIARHNDDGSQYYILLILTDGIICDMPQTKSAIVNASMLPLSIIIVGVGAADFEAMEELDGDDIRLAFRGRYAERDIVQFVAIRDFHDLTSMSATKRKLAKAVLAEIPDQLLSFMRARGIKPGQFTEENEKKKPGVGRRGTIELELDDKGEKVDQESAYYEKLITGQNTKANGSLKKKKRDSNRRSTRRNNNENNNGEMSDNGQPTYNV